MVVVWCPVGLDTDWGIVTQRRCPDEEEPYRAPLARSAKSAWRGAHECLAGRVSDWHFATMCAMLMASSEEEPHGPHTRALSPCHSDHVIKGGKTKTGKQ